MHISSITHLLKAYFKIKKNLFLRTTNIFSPKTRKKFIVGVLDNLNKNLRYFKLIFGVKYRIRFKFCLDKNSFRNMYEHFESEIDVE